MLDMCQSKVLKDADACDTMLYNIMNIRKEGVKKMGKRTLSETDKAVELYIAKMTPTHRDSVLSLWQKLRQDESITDKEFQYFAKALYMHCRGGRMTGTEGLCGEVDFLLIYDYNVARISPEKYSKFNDVMIPKILDMAANREERERVHNLVQKWRKDRMSKTPMSVDDLNAVRKALYDLCSRGKPSPIAPTKLQGRDECTDLIRQIHLHWENELTPHQVNVLDDRLYQYNESNIHLGNLWLRIKMRKGQKSVCHKVFPTSTPTTLMQVKEFMKIKFQETKG